MPLSNDEMFRVHVQNLRAVDKGCNQVYLQLKRCLALRQDAAASALLKVFVLLIGAWSEVRLLKLLYEAGGFSGVDRDAILSKHAKIDQWKCSLEMGFRRHYDVPNAALSDRSSDDSISSISSHHEDYRGRPSAHYRNAQQARSRPMASCSQSCDD